jgi:hypothetical protein
MGRKVRTNIVIDEDLVAEVMRVYGIGTRREAVDFALRTVLANDEVITDPGKAMLQLEGIWSDMTDEQARKIYDPDAEDE